MLAALSPDMLATDLAYYLARKGVRTYLGGYSGSPQSSSGKIELSLKGQSFCFIKIVVKPIGKRSDEVTKVKFMNL